MKPRNMPLRRLRRRARAKLGVHAGSYIVTDIRFRVGAAGRAALLAQLDDNAEPVWGDAPRVSGRLK